MRTRRISAPDTHKCFTGRFNNDAERMADISARNGRKSSQMRLSTRAARAKPFLDFRPENAVVPPASIKP